jgi:hypothetical protein
MDPDPDSSGSTDLIESGSNPDPKPWCERSLVLIGSVMDSDPDSIESLDAYPDSQSGSGSKRANTAQKIRKELIEVLEVIF